MPTPSEMFEWIISHGAWTLFVWLFGAIFMSVVIEEAIHRSFDVLRQKRQRIWFFGGCTVLFLFMIGTIMEGRPRAKLKAEIGYWVIFSGEPTRALGVVSIVNGGSAPSVVTGVSASAVVDGRTYIGLSSTLPEKVTLTADNINITYYGKDSLVVKASNPIPPGGEVNGLFLFTFQDAANNLFQRPNKYTLHYHDAYGVEYESSIEAGTTIGVPKIDYPGLQQDISPKQRAQSQDATPAK